MVKDLTSCSIAMTRLGAKSALHGFANLFLF